MTHGRSAMHSKSSSKSSSKSNSSSSSSNSNRKSPSALSPSSSASAPHAMDTFYFARTIQWYRQTLSGVGAAVLAVQTAQTEADAALVAVFRASLVVALLLASWKDFRVVFSDAASANSRRWLAFWVLACGAATVNVGTAAASSLGWAVLSLVVLVATIKAVECGTERGSLRRLEHATTDEDTCSLMSQMTISFATPVVNRGADAHQLDMDTEVPPAPDGDRTEFIWRRLSDFVQERRTTAAAATAAGDDSQQDTVRALWWVLASTTWRTLLTCTGFALLTSVATFVPPLALLVILRYVGSNSSASNSSSSTAEAGADNGAGHWDWSVPASMVGALAAYVLGQLTTSLAEGQHYLQSRRVGIHIRSALSSLLFDKALRCDLGGGAAQTTGQLTNLLAVDTESVAMFFEFANIFVLSLLLIVLASALLFVVMGWAACGGLVVLAFGVVCSSKALKGFRGSMTSLMEAKDKRLTCVNEVLQGVHVLKLNAWEPKFAARISALRGNEVTFLRKYMISLGYLFVLWDSLPTCVGIVAFLLYHAIHGTLDPWTAFYALSIFEILRFPMMGFPDVYSMFTKAKVAMRRIDKFLTRDDVEGRRTQLHVSDSNHKSDSKSASSVPQPGEIVMRSVGVAWPVADSTSTDDDGDGTETGKACERETVERGWCNWNMCGCGRGRGRGRGRGCKHKRSGLRSPAYASVDGDADDIEMQVRAATTTAAATNTTVLHDLTLDIPPGSLVCVVGPTGSGKSSLLEALLGEAKTVQGDWAVGGDVAYVNQKAWIRNATVRDNILFGKPMDAERYNKVIQACCLTHDLSILANGDLTEIGERGVNLSGGQQQRVNLARAVYHDADVFLLDDVLSAVDAHVGEHLFHECILGEMRGRTRVLATHQLALTLPHADLVLILDNDGRICHRSTGEELVAMATATSSSGSEAASVAASTSGQPQAAFVESRASFMREVCAHLLLASASSSAPKAPTRDSSGSVVVDLQLQENSGKLEAENGEEHKAASTQNGREGGDAAAEGRGSLVDEEERNQGAPGLRVYLSYVRSMGGFWVGALLLVSFLVWQLALLAQNVSLARWTTALQDGESGTVEIWCYVAACVGAVMVIVGRTISFVIASLRASQTIHDSMLASVLRAPLAWFESTPTGRILNRFSSDLAQIDTELMNHAADWLHSVFNVLVTVVVVSTILPLLIVVMLPAVALSGWLGRKYLNTSRDLKRLESLQKSPLYAHFSESLSGVSTIRAFDQVGRFSREFWECVDTRNRCYYWLWTCNRWMNLRMQLLSTVITATAAVFVVLSVGALNAATAGLVLLYATSLSEGLLWGIRKQAELEMGMNAVERTDQYASLEQEPAASVPSHAPSASWPEQGCIEFKNLWMRYPSNPDTAVLKGVSLHIPGGTRVGIVGRTGAGKSSLLSAIFRLVEPDAGSAIVIDGVNVLGEFGLADLRSRLAIVPQDPVLFQGTIRSNLDPFDEYSDEALWAALQQVHLAPAISALDGGLGAEVTEHGRNFSVGERQLLCMGRAVLKRSRVLIMDEATANVDPETDGLIQETVRHSLGTGCTVLCIAHRLHTVAYYDRVVVMDDGRVAEYDTPAALLERAGGAFRALCERSGNLEQLRQLAGAAALQ